MHCENSFEFIVHNLGEWFLYLMHSCRGWAREPTDGCALLLPMGDYNEAHAILKNSFWYSLRMAKAGWTVYSGKRNVMIKIYSCSTSQNGIRHQSYSKVLDTLDGLLSAYRFLCVLSGGSRQNWQSEHGRQSLRKWLILLKQSVHCRRSLQKTSWDCLSRS